MAQRFPADFDGIGRDTFDAPTAASGEIVASMRAVSLTGAIVSAPARRRERSSPILMFCGRPQLTPIALSEQIENMQYAEKVAKGHEYVRPSSCRRGTS